MEWTREKTTYRVEYTELNCGLIVFPVKFKSVEEAVLIADKLLGMQEITAVRIKLIVKNVANWKTK